MSKIPEDRKNIGDKDNAAINKLLIKTSSKIAKEVEDELNKRKGGGKK